MKNKLRSVHIDSVEWKYATSNGNVRIYEPGTKQIKARVKVSELILLENSSMKINPDTFGESFCPSTVKQYIENNLI